jgi:hypothetical protein
MYKTTLTIDREVYKAVKRVAVELETTVSSMVRKALLLYVSDPEAVEDTVSVLTDKRAMRAIRAGEQARRRSRGDRYVDWKKVRDL